MVHCIVANEVPLGGAAARATDATIVDRVVDLLRLNSTRGLRTCACQGIPTTAAACLTLRLARTCCWAIDSGCLIHRHLAPLRTNTT